MSKKYGTISLEGKLLATLKFFIIFKKTLTLKSFINSILSEKFKKYIYNEYYATFTFIPK